MSETKVEVVEAEVLEPTEATPETPVEEVKPTTVVEEPTTTFKDVVKAGRKLLTTLWSWKPVKIATTVAAAGVAGGVALLAVSKLSEQQKLEDEAMACLESGSTGTVDIPTVTVNESPAQEFIETTAEIVE